MYFVKTKDENTRELLEKEGFTYSHKEGEFYVFLNDAKVKFQGDETKIIKTNTLTF